MSVETTNNLRAAKREQAAAKKPAATKPVAKKAPAAMAKAEKPAVEKKMFTATARSGQAVHRLCAFDAKYAIDVADKSSTKPLALAGQVWQLFATEEKAQAAAERLRSRGYDVVITTATPVAKAAVA
jgi:hypothetical protein